MEAGLKLPERLDNVTVGTYNRLALAIKDNWSKMKMKSSANQRVNDIMKSGRIQPATHELPIICKMIGCTLEELIDPFFDLALAEVRVKRAQEDIAAAKYGLSRNAA